MVGRPKLGVWDHFNAFGESKNVQCKRCSEMIINARADKLERHIMKKCVGWTTIQRKEYIEVAAQQPQRKKRRVSVDASESRTNDYGSGTGDTQMNQEEFNKYVANYIYNSGASFRTVERSSSAKLTLHGRPGLTMPSRPVVSGRLLDEAVDDEQRRLIDTLRDLPYVAVTADGCKSVSHQMNINFVLVAPNMKPKLWKTVATEADSQTGEYIADLVIEVADEIDAAVGKGRFVAGVVTDNAKAMIAAWDILEKERGLICGGCGAHTMNLLLQDIGKSDPVVVAKATRVSTYFLQLGLLLARFEQERKLITQRRTGTSFNRTL
jgi:hypothetical protein